MLSIYFECKDRVPFKWLSPEALLWGQYSSKSDVWAFGILLWELYTFGGTPYPQVTTEQLRELHEKGYRLSRPPACPEKLYRIMRSCWRDDARQRPSFKQLEYTLDSLIQRTRGREYLELNPHNQHSFLSFTTEDMDDKMTSVDFVRRHRRLLTYENQRSMEQVQLNYSSVGHHDSAEQVFSSECFPASEDGSETQFQLNSKSTVTSGFQSMSSAHTM
ncbi:fibroblast growth factor receptor [Elysia marginata]|uniref:Fibroblast growth factor receptor n=1 Tax=Elysia marginata TaxID=1093978 RepID=A0AAV4HN71_9GAST|nr:fibroblast growth factor receptor [Elysia marginata]